MHVLALEHGPTWLELVDRSDVVPDGLSGRDYELWQPLLSIASFVESAGADDLLKLLQGHAVEVAALGKDDQVADHDETLLGILAEETRWGRCPTPGEILTKAQEAEPVAFRNWSARAVTSHLKRYGIPTPRKSGSRREFRDVTPEHFRRIQQSYGIDLDFPENETDTNPQQPSQ